MAFQPSLTRVTQKRRRWSMDPQGSREPRRPTTFSCLRAPSELVHPVPVCVGWSHAELRTIDASDKRGHRLVAWTIGISGREFLRSEAIDSAAVQLILDR